MTAASSHVNNSRTEAGWRKRLRPSAALVALGKVVAVSPVLRTAPLGPSKRRFANAVALIESGQLTPEMLEAA